jgi:hypothetical protein
MPGRRPAYRSLCILVAATAILALWGANAQAAIVGLERVSPSTPVDSSNKGITATCPAGKRLVGTGADVTPGSGHVLIDDIRPSADLQGLTVNAVEDETGSAANWYVHTLAICAYAPPGLVRVSATSATNSSNKSLPVNCPSGKRLLSIGAEINSPNGQVLLEDLTPIAGLASATVKAIEDQNGNPASWSLTSYAICANPIAGLVRVSRTTPSDSSSPKLVDAPCPAGKQAVGTGGDINTPNGQIVLDAVFPYPDLNTTGMGAWEDESGNTANWSLTAYAICANAAERAGAQGSPPDVGFPTEATASCPSGHQATGAGYEITKPQATRQVVVHSLRPDPSPPTSISTLALRHGFYNFDDPPYVVSAYAICATPLPGLILVSNTSASDSSAEKSVPASCPSGKKVVGVGGRVTDGFSLFFTPTSADFVGEVVMNGLFPNAALTSVQVNAFEDEDGFDKNWSLTAYAICANPPPGLVLVSASSAPSSSFKGATASCPSTKNLLGTGGLLLDGQGQLVIDDLRPTKALNSVTVFGVEDQSGYPLNWTASAFAICANP